MVVDLLFADAAAGEEAAVVNAAARRRQAHWGAFMAQRKPKSPSR